MGAFVTLTMVRDLSGRRFTTVELGTANVEAIRSEHQDLLAVAAAVVGVDVADLTREQVKALDLSQLRERLHDTPSR